MTLESDVDMFKKLLLSCVFCFIVFVELFSVSLGFSVGVKEGDWIEYGISFTGTPELTASSHGFEVILNGQFGSISNGEHERLFLKAKIND